MPTYTYKNEDGKFNIYVQGCEDMRPVRTFEDEKLVKMWIEDMEVSYEVGWDNGSQLGYKINEVDFDELEVATLVTIFSNLDNEINIIKNTYEALSDIEDGKLKDLLSEVLNEYENDNDYFNNLFAKFTKIVKG